MSESGARKRSAWGVVTVSNALMTPSGDYASFIYGFLVIVVDRDWGPDFRSPEHWQLLVFATEDTSAEPAFVIPGCNVKGACLGKTRDRRREIYYVADPERL